MLQTGGLLGSIARPREKMPSGQHHRVRETAGESVEKMETLEGLQEPAAGSRVSSADGRRGSVAPLMRMARRASITIKVSRALAIALTHPLRACRAVFPAAGHE